MQPSRSVPVCLISGFLGAGKTTLVKHLLAHSGGMKIGVIVNDFGSVNIDGSLIRNSSTDTILELTNGCICCSLQGELLNAVHSMRRDYSLDLILVESSGVSDPLPTLKELSAGMSNLSGFFIANAVTVVDTAQLGVYLNAPRDPRNFNKRSFLLPADPRRPLEELLLHQIECADLIILNKCDLLSSSKLEQRTGWVKSLNPAAEVISSKEGQVQPEAILKSCRFATGKTFTSARWNQVLHSNTSGRQSFSTVPAPFSPPINSNFSHYSEFGFMSFVYNSRRPFDQIRLHRLLRKGLPGLIRAKGFIWTQQNSDKIGELSIAGPIMRLDYSKPWWVSKVEAGELLMDAVPGSALQAWMPVIGDRRQEIVFIGVNLDQQLIVEQLNSCS